MQDRDELIARREAVADVLLERGWVTYHKASDFHWYERADALEAADAILTALESRPAPTEERYRHKQRGTFYDVIGVARLQAGQPQMEKAALTIYRGDDGKLWARNTAEFHDGRFEKVATETQPVAGGEQDDPVAVLRFAKGQPGNENEMPKVISCNWLPDGEYPVFLAKPTTPERAKALEADETCVLRKRQPGFFGDGHSKAKGADVERPDEPSAPD